LKSACDIVYSDGMLTPPIHIRLAILALCCTSLSACTARYVRIEEKGMTCAEAQQVAINAVRKMGYTIRESTKPTPGAPGIITGERSVGSNTHGVLVQIFCTTIGAQIEAQAEGGAIENMTFRNDFQQAFETAAAVKAPVRKVAESGVDVMVTTERPNHNELGIDLTGTGLLPVSIRITNHTPRRYRFQGKDVLLQQADGTRVPALPRQQVLSKVAAADSAAVDAKLLKDGELKPNDTVAGYLFFPFAGYTRARVTLEDIESQEEEGFAIEF
jgi:hypothetical protein